MSTSQAVFAVVPSHDHAAVLATRSGDGHIGLPNVTCAGGLPTQIDAVTGRWGIGSPFLRISAQTPGSWLLEFEALPADHPLAADAYWLPLSDLDSSYVIEEFRLRIGEWASEQRDGHLPELRAPWAREGWYGEFSAWVAKQLADRGITVTTGPVVVQQWGISAVLRQTGDHGDFYVKAVFGSPGRGFWQEPAVTEAFADRLGELVPQVVATDSERGWLLMEDMALAGPMSGQPASDWPAGLRALAKIQRDWATDADTLTALGCPDRRPAVLAAQLADNLACDLITAGLEPDEREQLAAAIPAFQQMCRRAEDGPIPMSVLHGDCHPGNVGVRADGGVCVYDWSDAALGHPFWDVRAYVDHSPAEIRDQLRQAYLDEWHDLADPKTLAEILAESEILACLYQVTSYRGILENLEPGERHIFSGHAEQWWRKALRSYSEMD